MSPFRISMYILMVLAFLTAVPAHADTAKITWYSGGDGKLNLKPIQIDHSSSVILAGTTSQKTLMAAVAKNNGRRRTSIVPLAVDGSFNVRYLIKDGIGVYTITFFGSEQSGSSGYQGLAFFTHAVKKKLPADLSHIELNDSIIEFVNSVMGTTVGRGECWDLAQQALDQSLADWTRPTAFGRLLNPDTDEIKPGDIIQFSTLKITEHQTGGVTKWETLGAPDHTAVIYNVLGKKHYTLAHQNVGGTRNVIKGTVNLTKATGGKYWIYRPVAQMIRQ